VAAKVRIGIIGTGGMAGSHAQAFKAIPGVELACCLDIVPGRAAEFAQKFGVRRAVTDLGDLLSESDAVSIVTPDPSHAMLSLKVLAARKHLLCEKPLTVTLGEARKVARAARAAGKAGVMHLINFSYRGSSAFQEAIKLVARGELGEIRHVNSRYLQSWLVGRYWGDWTEAAWQWRLQTAAGSRGALGDLGCHILDFTTAVAGDLKTVRCAMRTFPKIDRRGQKHTHLAGQPLDANDSVVIELSFAGGALGVCQTTRWATGHANTVALEVHGTRGALAINLDDGWDELRVCLGRDVHTNTWKTRKTKPTPSNYQRFIHAIRTRQPGQPDIIRGAQVQAYLDACERSALSGRAEPIHPWI
jgi:predicted dehydrogenase